MLKSLYISNYALINTLTIDWNNGFTVITGETGAGKSIIIGALSLVLGQRADTRVIKEGEDKCVVEAIFDVANNHLQPFFEKYELDYSEVCSVRREITSSGKSRVFINDTPVSLNQLRELTVHLLDIHSQHENLLLATENYQLNFVDAVAQNYSELSGYDQAYQAWLTADKKLKKIKQEVEQQSSDLDYLQFQYNQLTEAALQEGEQKELEEEQEMLTHVEEIKRELQFADYALNSDEINAFKLLKDTNAGLRKIQSYLPEAESWNVRLESILLDLKDIISEINKAESRTEFNPARLAEVEERISLLYTLQKKFKVETVESLIELRDSFAERLNRIENFEDVLREAVQDLEKAVNHLTQTANLLSESRLKVAKVIESFLIEKLIALGIPDVSIQVHIIKTETFTEKGNDIVQLLFSANKNRALQPIADIASGGEISRVMLAIKSLMVHKSDLPTIIFDEIDTGVSGEIANRVGEIMQFMSEDTQVITITHLPQIAAKGSNHFKVYKEDVLGSVNTYISVLNDAERENEIAQMLSGQVISEAALQNAKELLKK